MQTINPNQPSLWSGTFPMVLTIAVILLSTAGTAAAFGGSWDTPIKTVGTLVSADQAGQPNVFAIVSGDRVLYYEVSQVFSHRGRSALRRLPLNRIQVLGSKEAFDKLARAETCEQFELQMNLSQASSTAAFMHVTKPSAQSKAASGSPNKTCG